MAGKPIDTNKPSIVSTQGTPIYEQLAKKATCHKSLDFSNIGVPLTNTSGANSGVEKHLRQYHQTRIFVEDFSGMLHHNSKQAAKTYIISANLPQSISYGVGSTWEAPLKAFGGSTFNALMQFGSQYLKDKGILDNGASGIHRATSLLIWNGSKPLEMQLKIPVIDDNYGTKTTSDISTNLAEALEFLGCLCLPNGMNDIDFYIPPPSPLSASIQLTSNFKLDLHTNYARIMVQLGGVLLIDRCIIKSIDVNYPNTKTQIKHTYPQSIAPGDTGMSYLTPLLAEVTIHLTTVEAMTSDLYSKMLWLKPQNSGALTADLSWAGDIVAKGIDKVVGAVTGG